MISAIVLAAGESKRMGRTKQFLCRQARKMGLTNPAHGKPYLSVWKHMAEETARVIFEDFKKSSLGMMAYCKKRGYDDLGFSRTMREFFADKWDHVIELKAPKQSMYRLGRAFEYRARDQLRKWGYFVMRSPASRSPIDLVAVAPGVVLFVQCKRGGQLVPKEWNELHELGLSCGAIPVLAEFPAGRGSTAYWELTAKKDGSKKAQPRKAFDPLAALAYGGDTP